MLQRYRGLSISCLSLLSSNSTLSYKSTPQNVSSHDTKQTLKEKIEELLSEYLAILFLHLHHSCLTDYRSNISEILIKLILTISELSGFIVHHVLIYGFNVQAHLFLNLKELVENYFLKIKSIILIRDTGVVVDGILN